MKINELVDPQNFNAEEYDVKEDLIFFMNNDPDFYRKFYYPSMCKMKLHVDRGDEFNTSKFMPLIKHAYEEYKVKFPVKNIDSNLSEEDLLDISSKIYETELENISNGHYNIKK